MAGGDVVAERDVVDVVCLGESLVAFRPSTAGPLAGVPSFTRGIGGAESNTACALAAWGHRVRWIGRVGADGFGTHLLRTIASHGVDTSLAQRDPDRPTGVYFRTAGERAPTDGRDGVPTPYAEVAYYRAGSAASAMAPDVIAREAAWSGRVLHLSGITAALSAGCLALLRRLTEHAPGRPLVSFDVNYRAQLWRNAPKGPDVLAELARRCDLVLVGEDEAEAAWGLRGADAVRDALPEPAVLVVKRGAEGAVAYTGGEAVAVRAPAVDVVAPVGAGDAFAAGFLSATLRGLPPAARLRHGHLAAAAALTVAGDLGAPPTRAYADALAGLDAGAWGRLRLGPGWTEPAHGGEHGEHTA
ncbi:sugar kinase [Streptomyces sp. NPDC053048]|uniref:sugar kinase n=1 Tax=Streptomyces sp. NPDC053048 TaxID=3365694 RepID=UPI0037D124ED